MKTLLFSVIAVAVTVAVASPKVLAEPTVFQWKNPQAEKPKKADKLKKSSQEYWQTVSGKELKEGVALSITQAEHLIRVAPKAQYQQGQVIKPRGLDMKQLKLLDKQTRKAMPTKMNASQQQMRQAGFDDDSVALRSESVSSNPILMTEQGLNDNEQYLIHVIEKGSRYSLTTESDFDKSNRSRALNFKLDMNGVKPDKKQVKLKLHGPDSEFVNVELEGDQVVFDQPLRQLGAINGFYEVEALVSMEMNGQIIKRSVKVPFTNTMETIQMTSESYELDGNQVNVTIPFSTEMPGRYAIKATLAQVGKGKVKRIATLEVADEFKYGGEFVLPFKLNKKAKGKYTLVDIEFTDQTRMMKFAL